MKTKSMESLTGQLRLCTDDIENAGHWGLDAQVRAYNLLDGLLCAGVPDTEEFRDAAVRFVTACRSTGWAMDVIEEGCDQERLREELAERLAPLKTALEEARFEAAAAASLHEFAKKVFGVWQNGGIFSRRRALRELRERAGFRLESHRIGNYVAKTFDLMNQAQARFGQAQQAVFAADADYKIKKDTLEGIFKLLAS